MSLGRRTFLGSAVGSLVAASLVRRAQASKPGPRIVALDITATHIVVSAGGNLIAAAAAAGFRAGVSDLILDEGIIDIGHPAEPNLELLQSLKPDRLVSVWPVPIDSPLRRIAPILSLEAFGGDDDHYARIAKCVADAGREFGTQDAAARSIAAANAAIEALCQDLIPLPAAKTYLVNLNQDGVNLLGYGRHSLMDSVMRRLGVLNAWTKEDDEWGWYRTAPQALLTQPNASIVHLEQYWQGTGLAMRRLTESPIWNALPQVHGKRFHTISPIDIFGGLDSAVRFASLIADMLVKTG